MPDEWRDVVLLMIRETPSRTKPDAGYGLWVIQKVKNNKSVSVTVRSGSYYTDKVTGEKRYPKDGLNLYDFKALKTIYKEKIEKLLETPKDAPVLPPEMQGQQEDNEIEQPPW